MTTIAHDWLFPSIMTCASITQYQRDYDSSLKSSRYICRNQCCRTIIISLSCHEYAWYNLLLYVSSILIMSIMCILVTEGVFIWRRDNPLDRTSFSKRARFRLAFTLEKPAFLPGLARLAESPRLTTFQYFPTKPGIQYLSTSFHFITYT